jgi:hypothetical protein
MSRTALRESVLLLVLTTLQSAGGLSLPPGRAERADYRGAGLACLGDRGIDNGLVRRAENRRAVFLDGRLHGGQVVN